MFLFGDFMANPKKTGKPANPAPANPAPVPNPSEPKQQPPKK